MAGHLFMLFLETDERANGKPYVKDLKVELLGNFDSFILSVICSVTSIVWKKINTF